MLSTKYSVSPSFTSSSNFTLIFSTGPAILIALNEPLSSGITVPGALTT